MNKENRKKEDILQNDELRDHLYTQIEVEWNNNRNADLVDELAFRYPELANDLYEFFALLVQMEIEDEEENGSGGTEENQESQLAQWLENEGFEIALKAASEACRSDSLSPTDPLLPTDSNAIELKKVQNTPETYVADDSPVIGKLITYDKFLRTAQKRENMKASQIATEINTPLPLIMLAEEDFSSQFDPLRDEVSRRYAKRFGRSEKESRENFRSVAMVASTGTTTMARHTVEKMVKKLPKSEQDFWLKLTGFKK